VEGSEAGTELLTFTVITTDPNAVVEPLHDRMPVIIPERDYDRWLRAEPDRPPIDLLRPFDAEKMTAWKVDKAVGNVKNDNPDLLLPDMEVTMGTRTRRAATPLSLWFAFSFVELNSAPAPECELP
jgi:putative SOS response-associated peptidase YedK